MEPAAPVEQAPVYLDDLIEERSFRAPFPTTFVAQKYDYTQLPVTVRLHLGLLESLRTTATKPAEVEKVQDLVAATPHLVAFKLGFGGGEYGWGIFTRVYPVVTDLANLFKPLLLTVGQNHPRRGTVDSQKLASFDVGYGQQVDSPWAFAQIFQLPAHRSDESNVEYNLAGSKEWNFLKTMPKVADKLRATDWKQITDKPLLPVWLPRSPHVTVNNAAPLNSIPKIVNKYTLLNAPSDFLLLLAHLKDGFFAVFFAAGFQRDAISVDTIQYYGEKAPYLVIHLNQLKLILRGGNARRWPDECEIFHNILHSAMAIYKRLPLAKIKDESNPEGEDAVTTIQRESATPFVQWLQVQQYAKAFQNSASQPILSEFAGQLKPLMELFSNLRSKLESVDFIYTTTLQERTDILKKENFLSKTLLRLKSKVSGNGIDPTEEGSVFETLRQSLTDVAKQLEKIQNVGVVLNAAKTFAGRWLETVAKLGSEGELLLFSQTEKLTALERKVKENALFNNTIQLASELDLINPAVAKKTVELNRSSWLDLFFRIMEKCRSNFENLLEQILNALPQNTAQVQRLKQDKAALQEELRSLQDAMAFKQTELNDCKKRLQKERERAKQQTELLETTRSELESATKTRNELQVKIVELSNELDASKREAEEAQKTYKKKSTKLDEHIGQLTSQITAKDGQLKGLADELKAQQKKCAVLQDRLYQIQQANEGLKEQIEILESEKKALESEANLVISGYKENALQDGEKIELLQAQLRKMTEDLELMTSHNAVRDMFKEQLKRQVEMYADSLAKTEVATNRIQESKDKTIALLQMHIKTLEADGKNAMKNMEGTVAALRRQYEDLQKEIERTEDSRKKSEKREKQTRVALQATTLVLKTKMQELDSAMEFNATLAGKIDKLQEQVSSITQEKVGLSEVVADLTRQKEELTLQQTAAEQKISELEKEILQLNEQKQAQEIQTEALSANIKELRQQMTATDSKKADLVQQMIDKDSKLTELTTQIETTKQKVTQLETAAAEHVKQHSALTDQLKEVTHKLEVADTSLKMLQAQVTAANAELTSLRAENTRLTNETQQKEQEIQKLKLELSTANEKAKTAQSEAETAEQLQSELQKENDYARQRLRGLELIRVSLQERLTEAQEKGRTLAAQAALLTAQSQVRDARLAELETLYTENWHRSQDLETQLLQATTEIASLSGDRETQLRQIAELESANTRYQAALIDARAQQTQLTELLEQQRNRHAAQIEHLTADNRNRQERLREDLGILQAQLVQTNQALEKRSMEKHELETQVEMLSYQITEDMKELEQTQAALQKANQQAAELRTRHAQTIERAREREQTLTAELAAKTRQFEAQKTSFEELQRRYDDLTLAMAQKDQTIVELQAETQRLTIQLEQCGAALQRVRERSRRRLAQNKSLKADLKESNKRIVGLESDLSKTKRKVQSLRDTLNLYSVQTITALKGHLDAQRETGSKETYVMHPLNFLFPKQSKHLEASVIAQTFNIQTVAEVLSGRLGRAHEISYLTPFKVAQDTLLAKPSASDNKVDVITFFDATNDQITLATDRLTPDENVDSLIVGSHLTEMLLSPENRQNVAARIRRYPDHVPIVSFNAVNNSVDFGSASVMVQQNSVPTNDASAAIATEIPEFLQSYEKMLKKSKNYTADLKALIGEVTNKSRRLLFRPLVFDSANKETTAAIQQWIDERLHNLPMLAVAISKPPLAKFNQSSKATELRSVKSEIGDFKYHFTGYSHGISVLNRYGASVEAPSTVLPSKAVQGAYPFVPLSSSGWILLHPEPDLWGSAPLLLGYSLNRKTEPVAVRIATLLKCVVIVTFTRYDAAVFNAKQSYLLEGIYVLPDVVDLAPINNKYRTQLAEKSVWIAEIIVHKLHNAVELKLDEFDENLQTAEEFEEMGVLKRALIKMHDAVAKPFRTEDRIQTVREIFPDLQAMLLQFPDIAKSVGPLMTMLEIVQLPDPS